jgi:hypothetical protein
MHFGYTYAYGFRHLLPHLATNAEPVTEPLFIGLNPVMVGHDFTLVFDFSMKEAEEDEEEEETTQPSTYNEVFAQKMGGLFKRGELTDVVLIASDGRELAAHRAVLGAHSQV